MLTGYIHILRNRMRYIKLKCIKMRCSLEGRFEFFDKGGYCITD